MIKSRLVSILAKRLTTKLMLNFNAFVLVKQGFLAVSGVAVCSSFRLQPNGDLLKIADMIWPLTKQSTKQANNQQLMYFCGYEFYCRWRN